MRIGELSLGPDFSVVARWGLVDNRPFLQSLHGYGLSLRRLGRADEATATFADSRFNSRTRALPT